MGMVITTSCSSSWSCSNSYSIFTSQPPCPLSEGQQFTEIKISWEKENYFIKGKKVLDRGMLDSSVVCSLHFKTPTSVLSGNGLAGFFKAICDCRLIKSLSMLGCVCVCTNLFVGALSWSLIRPKASSEMRKVKWPVISMLSRPPSRLAITVIFSSILAWTLIKKKSFK